MYGLEIPHRGVPDCCLEQGAGSQNKASAGECLTLLFPPLLHEGKEWGRTDVINQFLLTHARMELRCLCLDLQDRVHDQSQQYQACAQRWGRHHRGGW